MIENVYVDTINLLTNSLNLHEQIEIKNPKVSLTIDKLNNSTSVLTPLPPYGLNDEYIRLSTACPRNGRLLLEFFFQKSLSTASIFALYKPNFQPTYENLTLDKDQHQISSKSRFIDENRICKNVIPSRNIFCTVKSDFNIFPVFFFL